MDESFKDLLEGMRRNFKDLFRRVAQLEMAGVKNQHYKGVSTVDFTTVTLPSNGDYGYQSADFEIQINCNGTIRSITTNAL